MAEDPIINNDLIKKIQEIEEKYKNKYLREDVRELYNEVIENECKDFKENVFFKQVVDIDEELDLLEPIKNYDIKKKKKRLKIYSDSDEEEDNNEENKYNKDNKNIKDNKDNYYNESNLK